VGECLNLHQASRPSNCEVRGSRISINYVHKLDVQWRDSTFAPSPQTYATAAFGEGRVHLSQRRFAPSRTRPDTRCYFDVRSIADMSQLNDLQHGKLNPPSRRRGRHFGAGERAQRAASGQQSSTSSYYAPPPTGAFWNSAICPSHGAAA